MKIFAMLCTPPVAIWPQTVVRLVSHCLPAVIPFSLGDVENLNSCWHPPQRLVRTDVSPAWLASSNKMVVCLFFSVSSAHR